MRDSLTVVCLHCVLLSGVAGLACKKHAAPSTPPATVASAAPPQGTAPAPAAASSPAQPVFDQWLASQNNGDFAVYQNLYAESFTAVARAGSRTRTIKRAAWLAEHKRKFRKPMTVVISDRRLIPAGDTLQARFTETVDSGTYHEEAEKVLTFAEVNGTWQIAKEELLAKKVDASKSAAMSSMAFVFV